MENNSQNLVNQNNSTFNKFIEEYKEHKFFGIIIPKFTNVSTEKLKLKITNIIKILNSNNIDKISLCKTVFEGLPDEIPSLRSLIWKLLLNYIPLNVENLEESIDKKRSEYNIYKKSIFEKLDVEKLKKDNILTNNKSETSQNNTKTIIKKNTNDHPLAMTDNSNWKKYFKDLELLEEIDKDVRRTRTNMHFFFMPAKCNSSTVSNEKIIETADKKRNEPGSCYDKFLQKNSFESNADVMCRILFIYGKKYPEIKYVQGMNEILAPIYYAFSNDQNPYFYTNLEADCYICFEKLMDEIKDIFIRTKDNLETGIQTRIKKINSILKIVDKEIYNHLLEQSVEIPFFAFRWYTLFLTQEFEMPDILRLWDSILSENDRFNFLNLLCVAIIKLKKNELMQSDFAGCMLALQNLEKLDVEKIIKVAESIRSDLNKLQII